MFCYPTVREGSRYLSISLCQPHQPNDPGHRQCSAEWSDQVDYGGSAPYADLTQRSLPALPRPRDRSCPRRLRFAQCAMVGPATPHQPSPSLSCKCAGHSISTRHPVRRRCGDGGCSRKAFTRGIFPIAVCGADGLSRSSIKQYGSVRLTNRLIHLPFRLDRAYREKWPPYPRAAPFPTHRTQAHR